jgi:hypothetical protein
MQCVTRRQAVHDADTLAMLHLASPPQFQSRGDKRCFRHLGNACGMCHGKNGLVICVDELGINEHNILKKCNELLVLFCILAVGYR